jgi:hypothetical protein
MDFSALALNLWDAFPQIGILIIFYALWRLDHKINRNEEKLSQRINKVEENVIHRVDKVEENMIHRIDKVEDRIFWLMADRTKPEHIEEKRAKKN